MKRNVVALFHRSREAEQTVGRLRENGLGQEQVSLIVRAAGESAAAGLTALVIPGLGPVVVGGPMLSMLSAPGGGLAAGTVAAALERLGLSMEEAQRYTDGIETGGGVVAVTTDDDCAATELRNARAATVIEREAIPNRPIARDQGDIEKTAKGPAQSAPENPEYGSSFDEFAGIFARDESVLLGERAGPEYEEDRGAYSFGYHMATQFTGREWVQVQRELQAEWRKQNRDDWDRFEDEIHRGWSIARGMG